MGDFLKLLELLQKAIHKTGDQKREDLAKDLLRIHLDICDLVTRGREILSILSTNRTADGRNISITLLTQQQRVLQNLRDHFASETLASIMQLHMPVVTRDMYVLLSEKGDRVWSSLDQLVSDGAALSPQQWVDQLEERMHDPDDPFTYQVRWGAVARIEDTGGFGFPAALRRRHDHDRFFDMEMLERRPTETFVFATSEEVERGNALLDKIAAANDQFREFIVQKFKIEDIL